MRPILWIGLAGVGLVWGIVAWIKAHGFIDFLSLVFVIVSVSVLSWFTVQVVKGGAHG